MRRAPLVLLHGFAGAPASYDATRHALRTYEQDRIFAPFLVGHGPEWTDAACMPARTTDSFEFEVAALADQVRKWGVTASEPAILVGYSLGARLALGLLASHPRYFRRGVLIGLNPGLTDAQARTARRAQDEARATQLIERGMDAFVEEWQSQALFDSQRSLPHVVLAGQEAVRRTNTEPGLAYSLRRTGLAEMPNYTPRLGAITVPLLLVVGELDVKFRAIADGLRPVFARAELAVVPGVGHNVPLEAPQALAGLLDNLPEEHRP